MDILYYYEKNLRNKRSGGWRLIARVLGMSDKSTGAAYEIAHGKRAITKRQQMLWNWWIKTQELLPEMVEVPEPTICSCGKLHTYDCKTKVVKPKPKRRPVRAKPRRRLDITDYDLTHQEAYDLLAKHKRG